MGYLLVSVIPANGIRISAVVFAVSEAEDELTFALGVPFRREEELHAIVVPDLLVISFEPWADELLIPACPSHIQIPLLKAEPDDCLPFGSRHSASAEEGFQNHRLFPHFVLELPVDERCGFHARNRYSEEAFCTSLEKLSGEISTESTSVRRATKKAKHPKADDTILNLFKRVHVSLSENRADFVGHLITHLWFIIECRVSSVKEARERCCGLEGTGARCRMFRREEGDMYIVIMAGGSGKRFWPLSRAERPKHFLSIGVDKPMLRHTFENLREGFPPERILVMTNSRHIEFVRRILPELPESNIFGEPCGRDTAPCVGLGAVVVDSREKDAVMVCLPADHIIKPAFELIRALKAGAEEALNSSSLIIFGIKPTYPATGFGYIHRGESLGSVNEIPLYRVLSFTEKPRPLTAKKYLTSGDYYWNSGIFVWRTSVILQAIEKYCPELAPPLKRLKEALETGDLKHTLRAEYPAMKKISIDYAVMECAEDIKVLEAPFEWNDVGSWRTVYEVAEKGECGNVVQGLAELVESSRCLIHAGNDRLVALVGVEDLIVVDTGDAVLICKKSEAEKVKELYDRLEERKLSKFL